MYIPHLQYQDQLQTPKAVQQHPIAPDKQQMIVQSPQLDYIPWHLHHSEAIQLWLLSGMPINTANIINNTNIMHM